MLHYLRSSVISYKLYTEVRLHLDRAISLDPTNLKARLARLIHNGDGKTWKQLITDHPVRKVFVAALFSAQCQKDYAGILEILNRAFEVTKDCLYMDIRASTYYDLGRYEDAVRDYNHGLARNPENSSNLLGRAKALFKLNQKDYAERDLAEVLRLSETKDMRKIVEAIRLEFA